MLTGDRGSGIASLHLQGRHEVVVRHGVRAVKKLRTIGNLLACFHICLMRLTLPMPCHPTLEICRLFILERTTIAILELLGSTNSKMGSRRGINLGLQLSHLRIVVPHLTLLPRLLHFRLKSERHSISRRLQPVDITILVVVKPNHSSMVVLDVGNRLVELVVVDLNIHVYRVVQKLIDVCQSAATLGSPADNGSIVPVVVPSVRNAAPMCIGLLRGECDGVVAGP